MRSMTQRAALWGALLIAISLSPGRAAADPGDVVLAEVLFRDGKDALAHKDYARACPKLAESFRLDPATGTLLALAVCHERQGRLASAWGEYADVASRSKAEQRQDREAAAKAKVAELEPKLSSLTILLPDGTPPSSVEIRRNGVVVAAAWLGTAVPVDGGVVTVEAFAPGNRRWQAQVAIAPSYDKQVVTIPPLENTWGSTPGARPAVRRQGPAEGPVGDAAPGTPSAPAATGTPGPSAYAPPAPAPSGFTASSSGYTTGPTEGAFAPSREPPATPPPDATPPGAVAAPPSPAPSSSPRDPHGAPSGAPAAGGLSGWQIGGIATGAVGVAGLATAGVATLVAALKNSSSHDHCLVDLCTAEGRKSRDAAITAGNVATGAVIGGAVLTATGLTMFLAGPRRAPRSEGAQGASLEARPLLSPQAMGAVLEGRF